MKLRPLHATLLLLVGLTAALLWPQRPAEGIIVIGSRFAFASVGLAPGQSLRVTAVNLGPRKTALPDVARVLIYDAAGTLIRKSGDLRVFPGTTVHFEAPRESFRAAGEAGTGRVQLRVEMLYQKVRPDGSGAGPLDGVAPAVEVLERETGRTLLLTADAMPVQ